MMNRKHAVLAIVLALTVPVIAQDAGLGRGNDLPSAPTPAWDLSPAHKLIQEGNYKEALLALKAVEARSPEASGLAHDLGIVYYHLGDFADAVPALQRAFAESASDYEAEQLLGMSFFQLGRPADAIAWLKKLKPALPVGALDIEYALGLCYLRTRDYDEARNSFATVYGVAPESAAGYLVTARMLWRQGDDPAAEQFAQKATALDARLPLAHLLLGEIYLYRSDLPKAVAALELELKLDPGYAGVYERLADAYLRMSRLNDAEVLLKRSLLMDGNSTGPYILLGKVQLRKKDYSQAQMYLEKAVRMDPNNFMSHHLLGEAYQRTGKIQEAEHELKLAEQLQSGQQRGPKDMH